jgi:hypothetical protein
MKDYPMNLTEFEKEFNTEEQCREYLFKLRWEDGYHCPRFRKGPNTNFGSVKVQVNFEIIVPIDSYFADMDYAYYAQVSSFKNAGKQKISIMPVADLSKNEFTILGLMVS